MVQKIAILLYPLIHQFLHSVKYASANNGNTESKTEFVAFVFAGGVRSFVLPGVHESIRFNLIHSFCPPSSCTGDVFVRLSNDDNTHLGEGYNSKGKSYRGNDQSLRDALKGIRRLAHDSPQGKLIHEVVNIGSAEEAKQMDDVTSKDLKQKIYRDLDPRRYSMHFNRWKAYEMMLKEERDSNKKYLWVVHARLDMAWGAPIKPFNAWSLDKMWVPDSWYADVPDTFALIPRRISDIYYMPDKQYGPDEVMCLGGPNFDVRTLQPSALQQRGYSPEQVSAAVREDCLTKFASGSYLITYDKRLNISWSSAGTSEVYLKRKLQHYGIFLDGKTLGFSSFFVTMSRFPYVFVCFYIEHINFIIWVKDTNHASNAIGTGCNVMAHHLNMALSAQYAPNCDLESYQSKSPLVDKPLATCSIDKKMSDWNFMPFRMRRKGDVCFTIGNPHSKGSSHTANIQPLHMAPCIDSTFNRGDIFTDYVVEQLFHFFPLSPLPQRILTYDYAPGTSCLTVSPKYGLMGSDGMKRLLELQPCSQVHEFLPQLFRVQIISSFPLLQSEKNNESSVVAVPHSRYLSSTVVRSDHLPGGHWDRAKAFSRGDGYHQILGERTVVMIKWEGDEGKLCLSFDDMGASGGNATAPRKALIMLGSDGQPLPRQTAIEVDVDHPYAVLESCQRVASLSGQAQQPAGGTRRPRAVVVLERTKIKAPTH